MCYILCAALFRPESLQRQFIRCCDSGTARMRVSQQMFLCDLYMKYTRSAHKGEAVCVILSALSHIYRRNY